MRLADAQTGPSALSLAPPAYPMDAVSGGVEATVTVTVDVNADGSPVIVEATYKSESRPGSVSTAFLASANESGRRCTLQAEPVAGKVVPRSEFRMRIDSRTQTSQHTYHGTTKRTQE